MKKCPGVACFLLQSDWKDPVGFYDRLGESSYYEKQEWSDISAVSKKNYKQQASSSVRPKRKKRNRF